MRRERGAGILGRCPKPHSRGLFEKRPLENPPKTFIENFLKGVPGKSSFIKEFSPPYTYDPLLTLGYRRHLTGL
jgi:hypothetical protein